MVAKFRNAGQTCVAANRVLVHGDIHDAFVELLVAKVREANSSGEWPGPLINARARGRIGRLVTEALREGARLATGGHGGTGASPRFEPTILVDVRPQMAICGQEIFGPVAPVARFETDEEAIRIANDTPYGLAAYVWTRDLTRIWQLLALLEFGMVGVNTGILSNAAMPFGGVKQSGFGIEGSRHGLDAYLSTRYASI
jgi:succinate-semialdehyde dehydrogenase/glutarate-semialdehyde dehydrogenase